MNKQTPAYSPLVDGLIKNGNKYLKMDEVFFGVVILAAPMDIAPWC